jgi:xylose isomerase
MAGLKAYVGAPITAKHLGLPENVANTKAQAQLRQRLDIKTVRGAEVVDTRSQYFNLRLEGEAYLAHLQRFEAPLNASLGVWFFTKGSTRFHAAYEDLKLLTGDEKGSRAWVRWIFERTAAMQKKLNLNISLQAHYPNEIGPHNVAEWVKGMEETGIGIDSMVPSEFAWEEYQYGSLTNPNKEKRELARTVQRETFQMAKLLGVPVVNHWLGIDGYEIPFGQNHSWAYSMIAGATAEAMKETPGQQATFEPKPYEPRAFNYVASTQEGMMLARMIEAELVKTSGLNRDLLEEDITMVGLTPEIGHMQMAYEVLARSFELALMEGRLFGIHWNGQPLGSYDIDENPGTFNYETMLEVAYVLLRGGFAGVNCLDINPLRMPLEDAVQIGFLNLSTVIAKARKLPHRGIAFAISNPEAGGNAAIQYLLLSQREKDTFQGQYARDQFNRIVGTESSEDKHEGDRPATAAPMTEIEIADKVIQVINHLKETLVINEMPITPKVRLVEDLGMTSHDKVEFGGALKEAFKIKIWDREILKCETLEDAIKLVLAKLSEKRVI